MAIGDMFLYLETNRAGVVKGESVDASHPNEIQVLDWSWGMTSSHQVGGAGTATRMALSELHIHKRADSATTALMSVMRTNDVVKKGVLSVRKAGGNPVDYLIITIERGRITSLDIRSDMSDGPHVIEHLTFAFEKIEVVYVPQDDKGQKKGGSTFAAETN